VKEDKLGRACNTHGEKRNEYRVLVAKPEGKKPLGRSNCWCEDDIKTNVREIGWG
jgi:hypothetical protein